MGDEVTVCVDLGGTRIKAAVVGPGHAVLAAESVPAQSAGGLRMRLPAIAELVRRLARPHAAVLGLGISISGLVDPVRKRSRSASADKWADAPEVDFTAWARREVGLPLVLENDAHAACLGEWAAGAGQGCDDLVMITLGTGVGTSVISRGRPLRGPHHQAGVLGGHFVLDPDGPPCGCGGRGCVETYTGAGYLPDLIRRDPRFAGSSLAQESVLDHGAVRRHAARGDAFATDLAARIERLWGALLVNLTHAHDPDLLIVGGGIVDAWPGLPSRLEAFVAGRAWTAWGHPRVVAARLGDHAGSVGLDAVIRGLVKLEYL